MKTFLGIIATLFFTAGFGDAQTTLDASAVEADGQRQYAISGSHEEVYSHSSLKVSGKYVKASDRPALYDAGALVTLKVGLGVETEGGFRKYQSHDTVNGHAGFRFGSLKVYSGARADYFEGDRKTYSESGASLNLDNGRTYVNAHVSYLKRNNLARTDYAVSYRLQVREGGRWFVSASTERTRGIKISRAGVGVRL
jgi:hypothetical protein